MIIVCSGSVEQGAELVGGGEVTCLVKPYGCHVLGTRTAMGLPQGGPGMSTCDPR